jgi:copper homeostasis protein
LNREAVLMDLEICVDSVVSALAAEAGGAQRVELCSALTEGGLTPSAGLIRAVRTSTNIGVHVMIRPRGGDFIFTPDEIAIMREDIAVAKQSGAHGVVLGILTTDGRVDIEATRALVELARPMEVTFHRAIDMTRDFHAALEDVIATSADRILTSGAEQTAALGSQSIAQLVRAAGQRITIMAGGGVRPQNVQKLAQATGASHFHAALRTSIPSPFGYRKTSLHLGDPTRDEYTRFVVLDRDVRALRQAIDSIAVQENKPSPTPA